MPRRVVVALAVAGALLILGIVALVAVVATLSGRPEVMVYRGEVVNISSDRDAIVIKTVEGHNLTGPLATYDSVEIGDQVTAKVINDADNDLNVVVVVDVRN
jgi:hypothetical protein